MYGVLKRMETTARKVQEKMEKMISNYSGNGKRIRRQYINGALFCWYFVVLILPVFLFVMDKINNLGSFDILKVFSICGKGLICSLPLLLISILNRNVFGKIVCIIDENGIYHGNRFVPWDKIKEIQYEIVLPAPRWKPNSFNPFDVRACYAYVIGTECKFKIMYAPHFILQIARKYNSNVKTGFSNESKKVICFVLCFPVLMYLAIANL